MRRITIKYLADGTEAAVAQMRRDPRKQAQ